MKNDNIDFKNYESILRLNKIRNENLFSHYNPYTSDGSPVERFKLQLDGNRFLFLPMLMSKHTFIGKLRCYNSVLEYAYKNGVVASNVENAITRIRIEYDFEFWSATCAVIQDKLTKRDIPFILRQPQRKLLTALYQCLVEDRPIRIILLKARQWGGSTLIQLFMAWIQLFHKKSWHSVIVADVEDQSRNIRSMYSRIARHHPPSIQPIKFVSFEGSQKNKQMKDRDCIVYIGSMQKPDSIRSADVMMAHLTEIGLWKETDGKKPEDVAQSILGTIPSEPYSIIVMESTAKGIGNYFHAKWIEAESGESGYQPVFVAWWEIEMYQKPFIDNQQQSEFVESMTEKEQYYFTIGATLEGLNWYRYKKHLDKMDDWRMACEFPTTPLEAFQTTGRRAHSPEYIEQMRISIREPLYKGDLFADARYGKEAINKTLHFKETVGVDFYVWSLPDKSLTMKNRYVVSVDIGGRTDTADWSVISVIDRYWLTDGGIEEAVATWRGHLDQDLVIWKAVQIATWYNNALLVPEANSLNKKGDEGDHSLTILDEIKDLYDNIYCRTDPQKLKEGIPARYGFHTNESSKTDLITQMNKRYREFGYIERDKRALDEADWYEIKPDGTYGAIKGKHDDIYMSRAIGLKASSLMDKPVIIETFTKEKTVRKNIVRTESSM